MISNEEYTSFCRDIKSLIKNGYEVMLFHQGFGETVVFMQLLYKHKELFNRKICLFTKVPTRTELLKQCPDVDEVMEIGEELFNKLTSDGDMRIYSRMDNFLDLHNIEGIHKEDVRIQVCDFLRIPLDTPMKPFKLSEVDANWDEYFKNNGIVEGRSVYIVPHAIFFGDCVPEDFWKRLAARLKNEGFVPVFNMPNEYVKDCPFAYFNMSVSLELAKRCGYIVGCRTGFMDLAAAFLECPIQVIYPDDSHPSWDICRKNLWNEPVESDCALKYMEGWGIKKLFKRDGIQEYIYDNTEVLIERIINNIIDYTH